MIDFINHDNFDRIVLEEARDEKIHFLNRCSIRCGGHQYESDWLL